MSRKYDHTVSKNIRKEAKRTTAEMKLHIRIISDPILTSRFLCNFELACYVDGINAGKEISFFILFKEIGVDST